MFIFDSEMNKDINMTEKVKNTGPKEIPSEVIGALADAFNKSFLTIQRWVEKNDDRLTSEKAREVFDRKNFKWENA